MTRRALFLMLLAGLARADPAADARDALARTVLAMGDGALTDAVSAVRKPELQAAIETLLHAADARSDIQILGNTGDDRSRTLKLDWRLHLDQHEGPRGSTERQAEVTCRLELRNGRWLITALEPVSFFAVPRGPESWNVAEKAAEALTEDNPAEFLSFFDSAMPGYDMLRSEVQGMTASGELSSAVELISNEGTDSTRDMTVDWTLNLHDPNTSIRTAERQDQVKFRLEWRDQHWKITRLDPLDFFRPL